MPNNFSNLPFALVFALWACPPPPETLVVVPAADNTPLTLAMDVYNPDLIPINQSGPSVTIVVVSDVVSVIGSATDNDGGIKAIKMWATYTYSKPGVTSGPGLAGTPVNESVSNATVGQETLKTRTVAYNFDLQKELGSWSRVQVNVWIEGENFYGGHAQTPVVSLTYPLDRVCDTGATECISLSKFSGNIDQALKGQVIGYVSIVGEASRAVTYGNARIPDDGLLPWRVDVPINVMSVSKVLTTIGVLQLLAKHNIQLTDKISGYLPPDWQPRGSKIDLITFKDLLTHRSGFRHGPSGDASTARLMEQIGFGVQNTYGLPDYNNLNFAIFRVLMPYMDGFADPGPATRESATANWYVDYMRQHVFQPVGVTNAACKPTGGAQQGMWYPTTPDSFNRHGADGGDWTLMCGGGGWNLSATDLVSVLRSLAADERLLTAAQKQTMNSECLGWDCSVRTQTDFVGKNGSWVWGAYGVQTFMGLFHQNQIAVVLLINSPPPDEITNLVDAAYANAKVPP